MSAEYNELLRIFSNPNPSKYVNGNLKFGVTIASYQRKNGSSPISLTRALESVLNQTATNWKIYLVGDKYENNEEFEAIIKSVFSNTMNKISYKNLDVAVEREKMKGISLWKVGGANAFNTAIQMALNDGCDYILHLDDDDYFDLRKIEILNYVCGVFNNPEFLFHYSMHMHNPYFPLDKVTTMEKNGYLPQTESLNHSSICCHRSIMDFFRYNNVPINDEIDCGDIQLIKYTQKLVKEKKNNSNIYSSEALFSSI